MMTDIDELTRMVDEASADTGDRYPQLVALHDALREALSETDGDAAATGR